MSIVLIRTALHLMNSIQADTVNVAVRLPLQAFFMGNLRVGDTLRLNFET